MHKPISAEDFRNTLIAAIAEYDGYNKVLNPDEFAEAFADAIAYLLKREGLGLGDSLIVHVSHGAICLRLERKGRP